MRFRITLSSPNLDAKTYDIAASSREEATAKGVGRYLMDNPKARHFDVSAVVARVGPLPTGPR